MNQKSNNVIISLDPSWTGFGMSIIDVDKKEIYLRSLVFPFNKKEPYNVYYYTLPILNMLQTTLQDYHKCKVMMSLEYHSTYGSYMQGEMLALDNLIINKIQECKFKYTIELELNLYYQNYIQYITKHKSSDKDFTIEYVEKILDLLNEEGYKVVEKVTTKSKKYGEHITDGEADSFIYLLRQLVLIKDDLPKDLQEFIDKTLLDIQPAYSDVKELPWKV